VDGPGRGRAGAGAVHGRAGLSGRRPGRSGTPMMNSPVLDCRIHHRSRLSAAAAGLEDRAEALVEVGADRLRLRLGPAAVARDRSCSSIADGIDGAHVHLDNHDVAFVAVSRARSPRSTPTASGWAGRFAGCRPTTATSSSTYNFAPHRGGTWERPGISAFALVDGTVFHTYSSYGRGVDALWAAYVWLDRAPLAAPPRRVRSGRRSIAHLGPVPVEFAAPMRNRPALDCTIPHRARAGALEGRRGQRAAATACAAATRAIGTRNGEQLT